MRQSELQRSASKLATLTPAQREAVEVLTRGLTNKLLHRPLQALKAAAAEDDHYQLETLREAFHPPDLPLQEEKKRSTKKKSEPKLVTADLVLCQP
jgi:glutamyl-tRNA reductase